MSWEDTCYYYGVECTRRFDGYCWLYSVDGQVKVFWHRRDAAALMRELEATDQEWFSLRVVAIRVSYLVARSMMELGRLEQRERERADGK